MTGFTMTSVSFWFHPHNLFFSSYQSPLLEQGLKMFLVLMTFGEFGSRTNSTWRILLEALPLGNNICILHDLLAMASVTAQQIQALPLHSNATEPFCFSVIKQG